MSINLISITFVWDEEKQKYVKVKEQINPNLATDISKLEKKIRSKKS